MQFVAYQEGGQPMECSVPTGTGPRSSYTDDSWVDENISAVEAKSLCSKPDKAQAYSE